jgi:hypothetical protein
MNTYTKALYGEEMGECQYLLRRPGSQSRFHCHVTKLELNWRVSVNWVTASVSYEDWKFGTVDCIMEYLARVVILAVECQIPHCTTRPCLTVVFDREKSDYIVSIATGWH